MCVFLSGFTCVKSFEVLNPLLTMINLHPRGMLSFISNFE